MIEKQLSPKSSQYGVSSIIGTILMIALTILLTAVVGSYAFNLASDTLTQPPQAGVEFDQQYNEFNDVYIVSAVLTTAPNVERVTLETGKTVPDGCASALEAAGAIDDADNFDIDDVESVSNVGSSAYTCVPHPEGGEVRAVGITSDSEQVITTHSVSTQE